MAYLYMYYSLIHLQDVLGTWLIHSHFNRSKPRNCLAGVPRPSLSFVRSLYVHCLISLLNISTVLSLATVLQILPDSRLFSVNLPKPILRESAYLRPRPNPFSVNPFMVANPLTSWIQHAQGQ
jgi:hypothetical protein